MLLFTLSSEMDVESLSKIGSGRYGMWTESWKAYSERPFLRRLIGLGFGEHYELIRTSFLEFDAKSSRDLDTHNDLLRMLYNLGPFALLAYLIMSLRCSAMTLLDKQATQRGLNYTAFGVNRCGYLSLD